MISDTGPAPRFDRKRLMVLGAGASQLPGILKAVEAGCRVISVDYLPDNIGHRHAHLSAHCDTRDRDCVLAVARELAIDGILSFRSDVAIPTVAHVADRLGLPGVPPEAAAVMTDKARFRAFQRDHGLPCPAWVSGDDPEALYREAARLRPPIYVKPVDGQGSQGVTRLDAIGAEGFAEACRLALRHSRAGRICAEEAVPGTEVGGMAFLEAGRIVFLCLTEKHLDGPLVVGHRVPDGPSSRSPGGPKNDLALSGGGSDQRAAPGAQPPPLDRERIGEAIATACARLGYRSGPLNFDIMVGPDRVTLLEMSPRSGGNGLIPLIRRATGVDLEEATIAAALGKGFDWPPPDAPIRGCGVAILGSRVAGRLTSVPGLAELRAHIPAVFSVDGLKEPGQAVEAFVHNGQAIAHVLFDCADRAEFGRIAAVLAEDPGFRVDVQAPFRRR